MPERIINPDNMTKVTHGEALIIQEYGQKNGHDNPTWFVEGQMYLLEDAPQWAHDKLTQLRDLT